MIADVRSGPAGGLLLSVGEWSTAFFELAEAFDALRPGGSVAAIGGFSVPDYRWTVANQKLGFAEYKQTWN